MDTRYQTLGELARQLRLPAAWLRREADAGRIPCLRAGKARMFDIDAVREALIERQRAEVRRG